VEAVVFRLPLVFSFVVLELGVVEVEYGEVELVVLVSVELVDGSVLYIPALELLELGAVVEELV
jgi:hypothetical protein